MSKKRGCPSSRIKKFRIRRKKTAPFRKNLLGTFVKGWNGKIQEFDTELEAKISLYQNAGGTSHYYEIVPVCLKR